MRIIVPIERKRYLYELRQQMGSFSDFWSERFTGVFFGSFIYVTHHAGHEWNRKITNEKSRAIGVVTKHGNGCAVNVILTRGYLDPWWMAVFFCLFVALFAVASRGEVDPQMYKTAGIVTAVLGVSSYLQCWFTEQGQRGMMELRSLLQNPLRFWPDEDEL